MRRPARSLNPARTRPATFALVLAILPVALVARPAAGQRGEWFDPRSAAFDRAAEGAPDVFRGNQFTFCRIRFTNDRHLSGGPWYTDFPDSDINFSLRLAELTTLDVNQEHIVLDLTDEKLFDYPFIYMIEVGTLRFEEDEIEPLRSYLLRGGFLMVDDFWGEDEWRNWEFEISRVFPPDEFPIEEIPPSHEIFNCVFQLEGPPQIPSIHNWMSTGLTYERWDAKQAHCRGIFDEKRRLMVVAMHNTDLGDGWEREGESPEYFREFSAKKAYPMGINIVVYAMTH